VGVRLQADDLGQTQPRAYRRLDPASRRWRSVGRDCGGRLRTMGPRS